MANISFKLKEIGSWRWRRLVGRISQILRFLVTSACSLRFFRQGHTHVIGFRKRPMPRTAELTHRTYSIPPCIGLIPQDEHRGHKYMTQRDPKADRRPLFIFFSVLIAVETLGLLLIAPLGFVPAVLIIMYAPAVGAIAARLFGPGMIWWGRPFLVDRRWIFAVDCRAGCIVGLHHYLVGSIFHRPLSARL